jgi:hypothetical protein
MNYTYRYIDPSQFSSRNAEFCKVIGTNISSTNAKKIGIICFRAIQIYEQTRDDLSKEKTSLRMWVRDQRVKVRNHGRVVKDKNASSNRASMNALISNINDQVLNKIDSMDGAIQSNLGLAKDRLEECLTYTTIEDIKQYEIIYLEEKKAQRQYENLKGIRISLYVSIIVFPIVAAFFVSQFSLNVPLAVFLVILFSCLWGLMINSVIRDLTKKIVEFERAKASIRDLKTKKSIEDQDSKDFLAKLNPSSSELSIQDNKDINDSEEHILRELAKKLQEEYLLLENACLNFDIDANNWLDLAGKVYKDGAELPDQQERQIQENNQDGSYDSERYTVETLQIRFSTFQEAKEFYGVSAKGWQSLVEKLNSPSSINDH